jgi:hypothetical protein
LEAEFSRIEVVRFPLAHYQPAYVFDVLAQKSMRSLLSSTAWYMSKDYAEQVVKEI